MDMPALSPTMTSGQILEWSVQEGSKIAAGESYCDVETDKATVSYDATEDGYIARILVPAGPAAVKCGDAIAIQVGCAKLYLYGVFVFERLFNVILFRSPNIFR